MFCSKCGNELREGAKFCPKCGTPVRNAGSGTGSSPVNILESEILPAKISEPKTSGSHEQKPGASGLKLFGMAVLALVAIALLVFVGYLLFFRGNGGDGDQSFGKNATEVVRDEEPEEDNGDGETGESEETVGEPESNEKPEPYTGEKQDISITVRQVDNTQFPEVTLYVSITDQNGNPVEQLSSTDFLIKETGENGTVEDVALQEVYQVLNQDKINVNLVLDASDSMDGYGKMQQAKNAANALIGQMNLESGDQVEVISFGSFVYLAQDFTGQKEVLQNAVAGIGTAGETALYDALYAGLFRTYYETGAKCVIGFTDGMENASSCTFGDVVSLSRNTGIPVFIIGIGEECDAAALQNLAGQCSGKYYSADVTDLETILEDIYLSIYQEQQDYYVIKYTAVDSGDLARFRNLMVETSDSAGYEGHGEKQYVPMTDISGPFSDTYMNRDQILDFSSQRAVTEWDLTGLSLAELRIARNEIYARHGRQFKDGTLKRWFNSKIWYLNIPVKYSPTDFDSMNPNPLSTLEQNNAAFILEYENMIMSSWDIFPDAGAVLLTDYDLALTNDVLRTALAQMQTYPSTSILEENIGLVQEAINQEDTY